MKKYLFSFLSFFTLGIGFCQSPAFVQTSVVTGLNYPVAFDIAPDGRFFVTQKGGTTAGSCAAAFIKVYSSAGVFLSNFYDLTDSVQCDFERGLLGICLDPNFTTNHYVYAYYNHKYAGDERIRVVRFTEAANIGTNPFIVFDLDVAETIAGNHVGGNLHMHISEPDKIYIPIGDLAYNLTKTTLNYAQKLYMPFGKMLRVNTNGTIPTDNPYYDDGNPLVGNCDYIWSVGHRNPFDFTFSDINDSLYSAENGQNAWDEINQIHRGANYGWNTCEGNFLNGSTTTPCSLSGSILPIEEWAAPLPSVTGILHYHGTAFPTLNNHLLVADNDYGRIYDVTLSNAPAWNQFVSRTTWADFTTGGLTTLKEGTDECVYAMKGGYTTTGIIYRICSPTLGVSQNNNFINELMVSPNPSAGILNVSFVLNIASEISLELTDLTGRIVLVEKLQNFKSGQQEIQLNLTQHSIANGLFFLKIKTGKENNFGERIIKIVKE